MSETEPTTCDKPDNVGPGPGDRSKEIVKQLSEQLADEPDVLAYYVSVVTSNHHSSVRMGGFPNQSLVEGVDAQKADMKRGIAELYEGMLYLVSHEMKTEEGHARLHTTFETVLEKGERAREALLSEEERQALKEERQASKEKRERQDAKVLTDAEYESVLQSMRLVGQQEGAVARARVPDAEMSEASDVSLFTWIWICGEIGFGLERTPYEAPLREAHAEAWRKGWHEGPPDPAEAK